MYKVPPLVIQEINRADPNPEPPAPPKYAGETSIPDEAPPRVAPRTPHKTAVETDRRPDKGPATNDERVHLDAGITEYYSRAMMTKEAYRIFVTRQQDHDMIPSGVTDLSQLDFHALTPKIRHEYSNQQIALITW